MISKAASLVFALARVCLGAVLVISSSWKLRHPYEFLIAVYQYELLGLTLGLLVAMCLPWIELVAGLCLVSSVFKKGALTLASLLFACFMVAQMVVLFRGRTIPCSCITRHGDPIDTVVVARTAWLLLVSLSCLVRNSEAPPSERIKEQR